jgi:single-strand DNA-binding protein
MMIVQLAGHLGADPESRFTQSGQKVTTLRMAVNHRKGKEDVTVWWRVTIWGEQFERMMPYIKKGSGLMVVGEMQAPDVYADREGNQRISMECTALHLSFNPFGRSEKREGDQAGGMNSPYAGLAEAGGPRVAAAASYSSPQTGRPAPQAMISDEVPF